MKEIGKRSESASESEREKTKMRERQRRAITSNVFRGLRKHGSYRLSPRADINEVLRELAKEAGWVVEPDGTTYRSNSKVLNNRCPLCGAGKWSTTSLPLGGGDSLTDHSNNASLLCFDQHISVPLYPSVAECSANAMPMAASAPAPAMTYEEGEALHLEEEEEAANMSNHLNTALVGPLLPLPHF